MKAGKIRLAIDIRNLGGKQVAIGASHFVEMTIPLITTKDSCAAVGPP